MTKIFKNLFLMAVCIFVVSCSGGSNKVNSTGYLSEGQYKFVMYDSTGSMVSEGNLTVKSYSDSKISGNYNFIKVISEFEGYQSMKKGEFTGNINTKEKMVLINTNPTQADDNVFFNLKIESNRLEGQWYYAASRRVSASSLIKLTKTTN